MALIKHAQAQTIAREAVVLDLGDLARQGREFMAQARAQADRMLADARAERERIVAGAAEKGHAQGYAEGLAKGHKEGVEKGRASAIAETKKRLDDMATQWSVAAAQFNQAREDLLALAEREVLDLALVIAAKVTKRQVQTDPTVAVAQTRAVLELITRPSALALTIHPDDRALVEQALPELMKSLPMVRHVQLLDDQAVSRGSVFARGLGAASAPSAPGTGQNGTGTAGAGGAGSGGAGGSGIGGGGGGEIDASIETQLARIVDALVPGREAVDEPHNEPGRRPPSRADEGRENT